MKKFIKNIEDDIFTNVIRVKTLLDDSSGDQMTGMLIVILCVVVAGSAFIGIYQGGLQTIWGALEAQIIGLLGGS